jgi:hypothetical protein
VRTLIIILSFSFISGAWVFAQPGTYQLGWVVFHDSTQFSQSFMVEMERQLRGQFDLLLEEHDVVENYNFWMNVDQPDSLIQYRDGFAFLEVEIYDLRSYSKPTTICWRTDSLSDLTTIHSEEVDWRTVRFSVTSDFPRDEYQEVITPQVRRSKDDKDFGFDVNLYLYVYPDLTLRFYFKVPPSAKEIERINTELEKIKEAKQSFNYTPIEAYQDPYYSWFWFSDIPTQYDEMDETTMSTYVDAMLDVFRRLSKSDIGDLIESVRLM